MQEHTMRFDSFQGIEVVLSTQIGERVDSELDSNAESQAMQARIRRIVAL